MSLSITTDLRNQLGTTRDQGRRPTCLAFASSAAHQHAHKHTEEFSVEWLYYHSVVKAGDAPEDGSSISDARSVIAAPGQPIESEWPYLAKVVDVARWKPPAVTDLHHHTTEEAYLLEFETKLQSGIPIVTSLYISDTFLYSNMWTHLDNQVILPDDSSPVDTARAHAVVILGSADLEGKLYFLLRNSWGSSWADNGHAWISYDELERLFIDAFSFTIGASYV